MNRRGFFGRIAAAVAGAAVAPKVLEAATMDPAWERQLARQSGLHELMIDTIGMEAGDYAVTFRAPACECAEPSIVAHVNDIIFCGRCGRHIDVDTLVGQPITITNFRVVS